MIQNEIAISVQGLKKSYKSVTVLEGVDFEVKTASIFALLGSNGAGKTTIVKILTTLLKQDSGTATVNGYDVVTKPDYVRQSISLTVMTSGLRSHGASGLSSWLTSLRCGRIKSGCKDCFC